MFWIVSGASSGIGAEFARQLRPMGVTGTVHELNVAEADAIHPTVRDPDNQPRKSPIAKAMGLS